MKSTTDTHSSYQKPTLRSEAFARAVRKAKLSAVGSGALRSLFEQAARKAASLPRQQFKENWSYLQTMLRLVGAYERGEYKQVSNDDLTVQLPHCSTIWRPIPFDSRHDPVARFR